MLPAPKRVLVIKLGHHGDVLLSTPLVRALKERYPEARIDMLVFRETAPMLTGNPDIGQVFTLARGLKGWARLTNRLHLLHALRKQRHDWVFHLSDHWPGALVARLSGACVRVAFDYRKRRNAVWRGSFSSLVQQPAGLHTVEQNLRILEPLGIEANPGRARCVAPISAADTAAVESLLRRKGIAGAFLVVHPGARWFFKCWEDERFAALIQSLADEGWPVIITSSPERQELDMVASIMARVDSPRVHSAAGELSLNTLAALIARCRLFIGVDSAPMHLAAACGKDTVALFGLSKIESWRPWQTRHCLIDAADYGPLIAPEAVDTGTRERYLSNIPVQPVLAAARQLLSRGSSLSF